MYPCPIKIHISSNTIIEFLLLNTNLDLKKLIPKAVADYVSGRNDKLINGKIEICQKKKKIPEYIVVYFEDDNIEIVNLLNKLDKKKNSSLFKNIFETKFASEHFDFLLNNQCFIPINEKPKTVQSLSEIVDMVSKGDEFQTTIDKLMKICNQQKRTDKFIETLYDRLLNAGAIITMLNKNRIQKIEFKTIAKETEIIIKHS